MRFELGEHKEATAAMERSAWGKAEANGPSKVPLLTSPLLNLDVLTQFSAFCVVNQIISLHRALTISFFSQLRHRLLVVDILYGGLSNRR